jgi:ABC-type dipeptide/oligopeptide/nickel transport system permease subunit
VAPIIVYSSILVAANILAEAGLSFIGLGIVPPTASWGNLLAQAQNYYQTDAWILLLPGIAILFTTIAFNLMGDGVRDAFDPRSRI